MLTDLFLSLPRMRVMKHNWKKTFYGIVGGGEKNAHTFEWII